MNTELRGHRYADLFPLLEGEELDALAEDIGKHGLRQPIILYGKPPLVLDGRNRLAACKLAAVEPVFETFDGSDEDALALVVSLNLARRHLTTPQRAVLAVQLLPLETEAARKRQGARTDIHQIPDRGDASGRAPKKGQALDLAGARAGVSRDSVWKANKISKSAPDVFRAMQEGVLRTMGEALKLSRLDGDRRGRILEKMRAGGLRLKDAEVATPFYYRSSGTVEWYSPPDLLAAGRKVLGGLYDLDPASTEEANEVVQAVRFFTIEDDGLQQEWLSERLWCNPPYGFVNGYGSDSRQGAWVEKLVAEHEAGRTRQALLLVRAAPCNQWFKPLWRFPLAFLQRRLRFTPGPGVTTENAVAYSAIVGIGVDEGAFVAEFSSWGQVVLPADGGIGAAVPT